MSEGVAPSAAKAETLVLVGCGQIGQAVARRAAFGKS